MSIATPTEVLGTAALDLVDKKEACAILGGSASPLDPSTLYRGIKRGLYPAPIKMGPGLSRWIRAELLAAIAARAADRDTARAA
jgi:predicted DNA-binding transcriptional regulator AlpA